jgi:hypothetical protein
VALDHSGDENCVSQIFGFFSVTQESVFAVLFYVEAIVFLAFFARNTLSFSNLEQKIENI